MNPIALPRKGYMTSDLVYSPFHVSFLVSLATVNAATLYDLSLSLKEQLQALFFNCSLVFQPSNFDRMSLGILLVLCDVQFNFSYCMEKILSNGL